MNDAPRRLKRPLFNHTKESCLFCRGIHDKRHTEISSDWLSYLCKPCMEEYAKDHNFEFIENNNK